VVARCYLVASCCFGGAAKSLPRVYRAGEDRLLEAGSASVGCAKNLTDVVLEGLVLEGLVQRSSSATLGSGLGRLGSVVSATNALVMQLLQCARGI
jgi:hypothetical protein